MVLECLEETFIAPCQDGCSDAELIGYHLNREWLGGCGTATINGEEVFLFEYDDDCAFDELYEPAELAEMLRCGLQMVEMSRRFDVGTTAFFTENRTLVPRRKTGDMAPVVI